MLGRRHGTRSPSRWARWALLFGLVGATAAACGSSDDKKKAGPDSADGGASEGGSGDGNPKTNGGKAGTAAGGKPIDVEAGGGLPGEAGAGATGANAAGAGGAGSGGTAGETAGGATTQAGAGGTPLADAGSAGAGGTGSVLHVFSTVTALYDAIDAAQLAEGDAWRVEWQADARVGGGSIEGSLLQGEASPSALDQGALPLKLFTGADWTPGGVADSFTVDADGYPTVSLATDNAAGASAYARLNPARYGFRRFTLVRVRIAQDVSTVTQFSGVSVQLWGPNSDFRLIGNHFVEAGGATQSVAIDYYKDGMQVLTNGVGTSAHGKVFEGYWSLFPASPTAPTLTMTMRLEDLQHTSLGSDTSAIVGHGDWSVDGGRDYNMLFSLYRQPGGSGTATATGVSFEVTRYLP